jgi:hypothetical protein
MVDIVKSEDSSFKELRFKRLNSSIVPEPKTGML